METVFRGLHWHTLLIYLDDIIVFSGDFDQHLLRLEEVLQRLRKAGLKLKPEKCSLFASKNVKFEWKDDCQTAFDKLKEALVSSSVLAYPDFTLPFQLDTDASDTGVGAVLSQVQQPVWKEVSHPYRPCSVDFICA